jgi:hypothetical protein
VTGRRAVAVALGLALLGLPSGCGSIRSAVPACRALDRLALVAQSVPSASYVPCLEPLAAGWRSGGFLAADGRTRFQLTSDRAPGRPVRVDLTASCDVSGATPTTPRAAGVRTYTRLRSITPRYAGSLLDVFAGGCVTYRFDFQRGPHIALMEELQAEVGLYPRQELAAHVRHRLGVEP